MSLKLSTPFPIVAPSLFPNSNPSGIRFSRWGNVNAEQRKVGRSLSLSLAHSSRTDQIRCGIAGGGDVLETGVWWDLNTCPVPDGVDPRCVRPCIVSALEKQIGLSSVNVYAIGNLEYISADLLKKISSSGIVLIHAPCGGNDLYNLLEDWSEDTHPPGYVMLISQDITMVDPYLFRGFGFTNFVVYPKHSELPTLDQLKDEKVFAKEFVWETLLSDNFDEYVRGTLLSDNTYEMVVKPLCICNICNDVYHTCDEACDQFITHLKSEEHINELFNYVPIGCKDKPKHFCEVCNYPAYDEYNLFLHNQSEEHNRKLVEKQAQEEEDCESRKRNPQVDLFNEEPSLERGKHEDAA
ncbi:unnamed protein product [Eruca vesicaria subsp. sativa]|uniref:NYN domain-containing protein n=1 Tax=Eruca vesicaria subsp. sativa TaxID=29727 RepID=A0ABC8JBA3_ERUVS|nr:unnamed protein product [Eruca vesicaria subsp. sativa]